MAELKLCPTSAKWGEPSPFTYTNKKGSDYMKKLLSLALALMMILSLATVAFADTTDNMVNVTVNDDDNILRDHTFVAYQIFTGEVSGEAGNYTLSNIDYGTGINIDDFCHELSTDSVVSDVFGDILSLTGETPEAADVAEKIASLTNDAKKNAVARIAHKNVTDEGTTLTVGGTTALAPGYYLIVDKTEVNGENQVANLSLLRVVKDSIEIKSKVEKPTIEKKVYDVNDTNPDEIKTTFSNYDDFVSEIWEDSADHDIGDTVWYKVTFTIPANTLNNYDSYTLTITDTLSKGLTYKDGSSVFYRLVVDKDDGYKHTDIADYFEVTSQNNVDGTTTLTLKPNHEGKEDLIKILDLAGADYNLAEEYVFVWAYSCELNENAVIGSKGNPNEVVLEYSNNPYGEGMGKTEKDKAIVFTYELEVDKVDGQKKPLSGAEFTLYKEVATAVEGAKTGDQIKSELRELDEGVNVDDIDDDNYYVALAYVKGDGGDKFYFKGLDDGNYVLVETKTPAGYNTCKSIQFNIGAIHDGYELTELSFNSFSSTNVDLESGKITTEVENRQGSHLPETGGIGTTIFYVLGAVMVVGAAVLLVTKKRMSAAE